MELKHKLVTGNKNVLHIKCTSHTHKASEIAADKMRNEWIEWVFLNKNICWMRVRNGSDFFVP